MPGNVYCFNNYNEPINQFNVNGSSFGTNPVIGGWAAAGATIYTPLAVPVPRVRHGDGAGAAFASDQPTPVRVNWDSWTIQGTVDLTLVKNVSLDDDLILYIAINQLTLMDTRGFVLLTVPVSPLGQSQAATAELKAFEASYGG